MNICFMRMAGSGMPGNGSLCERVAANQKRCLCGDWWGLSVFVGGKRLRDGQYLVIISNESSRDLWEDYRKRWKIETLFQALKGRGFDLESCRLSQQRRLSDWFGFLALGLCWCLKVGRLLDSENPLPLKKHGRRAVSVFQRGLRELQVLLAPLAGRPSPQRFALVIEILSAGK
jgi:hypothetical protein